MPRTFHVFGDIEGKLDVLRVECTKCDRKGLYHVAKLIEKYGRKGNMSKWHSDLNSDCPKRDSLNLRDRCDVLFLIWRRCYSPLELFGARSISSGMLWEAADRLG